MDVNGTMHCSAVYKACCIFPVCFQKTRAYPTTDKLIHQMKGMVAGTALAHWICIYIMLILERERGGERKREGERERERDRDRQREREKKRERKRERERERELFNMKTYIYITSRPHECGESGVCVYRF